MDNKLDPERIAYWFFRLNGCFILDNFLVHHPQRGSEGTDIDILAMRFPYRRELASSTLPNVQPMIDHPLFEAVDERINIYLVEVKKRQMSINASWKSAENLQFLLNAVGAFPEEYVLEVSTELSRNGRYANEDYQVQYVALGSHRNEKLLNSVATLKWEDVLRFIYQRLHNYYNQKSQHRQWDPTGSYLYHLVRKAGRNTDGEGEQQFIKLVVEKMQPSS